MNKTMEQEILNLLAIFLSLEEQCAVICHLQRLECVLTACFSAFSVAEGNSAGQNLVPKLSLFVNPVCFLRLNFRVYQ